jgi:4a-hydroxytetrahydrobiopterin dehydratase
MSSFVPLSFDELQCGHCRHMTEEDALTPEDIAAQLQAVPHWQFQSGALRRTFSFDDYYRTMAFVNALAWIAHREDHHPELTVTYNRVTVAFDTHSAKGISLNDFICAAQADAVYGS